MSTDEQRGVVFPAAGDGRRSTAALGRAVVADALRPVDPAGALAAEQETNWRSGYLVHFRRLVEAGLASGRGALAIAAGRPGVAARPDAGGHRGRRRAGARRAGHRARDRPLATVEVPGTGAAGDGAVAAVPRRAAARRRAAPPAGRLGRPPGWWSRPWPRRSAPCWPTPSGCGCRRRTVAVLGAGAEMGPLPSLLRWGARVAAVDLPRPAIWERVLETARRSAGTLLLPVRGGGDARTAGRRAGADLLAEAAGGGGLAGRAATGRLVLGNYVYADGATNVRVCGRGRRAHRPAAGSARDDVALAFLATPTDVFAVPAERGRAVDRGVRRALDRRPSCSAGRCARCRRRPAAAARLPARRRPGHQRQPGAAAGAELRAGQAAAAVAGGGGPATPAPPCRSTSPRRPGPARWSRTGRWRRRTPGRTASASRCSSRPPRNVLMAALLVHDLHTGGGPAHEQPWQDEAYAAVHGGLWRAATRRAARSVWRRCSATGPPGRRLPAWPSGRPGAVPTAAAIGAVAGAALAAHRGGRRAAGLGAVAGAAGLAASEAVARAAAPGRAPAALAADRGQRGPAGPGGLARRPAGRPAAVTDRGGRRHRRARRPARHPPAEGACSARWSALAVGRALAARRRRRAGAVVAAARRCWPTGSLSAAGLPRRPGEPAGRAGRAPRTCRSWCRWRPAPATSAPATSRELAERARRRLPSPTRPTSASSPRSTSWPGRTSTRPPSTRWSASSTSTPPGSRSTSCRSGGSGCGPGYLLYRTLVARPLGPGQRADEPAGDPARRPQPHRHHHAARRRGGRASAAGSGRSPTPTSRSTSASTPPTGTTTAATSASASRCRRPASPPRWCRAPGPAAAWC